MRAGSGIGQHLPSDSPLREPSPEAFLQHRYLVLGVKASAVHHQNQPFSGATRLLEKPKEQIFRLFASVAMQIHVRLHREVSGAQFPQGLTANASESPLGTRVKSTLGGGGGTRPLPRTGMTSPTASRNITDSSGSSGGTCAFGRAGFAAGTTGFREANGL